MGNGVDVGIHLYPMISHFWFDTLAGEIENDEVGLLFRHVAIDAVAHQGMIGFQEDRGTRLVTTQAALGELGEIMLRFVDIVAGQAGHGRLEIAAAVL